MKTSLSILTFVLIWATLTFLGCNDNVSNPDDNTIHGSGNIVSETRQVEDCTGVSLTGAGNIYLSQGDRQEIRIEADDNIIKKVLTRRENGVLSAGLKDGSYSDITVKIYVTLKSVDYINIVGAGTIITPAPISFSTLHCDINGAGTIELEGTADNLTCVLTGAGKINAQRLSADTCSVILTGAGNCNVWAVQELNATLSGTGTIKYKGNPGRVNTYISGLGSITAF